MVARSDMAGASNPRVAQRRRLHDGRDPLGLSGAEIGECHRLAAELKDRHGRGDDEQQINDVLDHVSFLLLRVEEHLVGSFLMNGLGLC